MHLAVIASSESWYLRDLRRAAAGKHEVTTVSFARLVSQLDGSRLGVSACDTDLQRPDCVLVRAMPPGSLEQIVFRMDVLGRLEAAGTPVVNPPRALEAAVDKYLASARLLAAGLPVPRTIVCQTVEDAMDGFAALGGDVVVKPLFGSEGRGMTRVSDEAIALRVFKALVQFDSVLYLQEFIPHNGYDYRLLVIGDRVLSICRRNDQDWRTNIAQGGVAEPFAPTDEMLRMARAAADAVGAPIAGVDLLPGRDGRLYAIEVNAVPGWKGLASSLDVDVAGLVLEYCESLIG
ncbi:MAG: RimK family alpha-L-glutamate ligase [Pirellulales bacterium]|nr:RimK family alpha-L-glutamate ligase [Pirellulales bacterium]